MDRGEGTRGSLWFQEQRGGRARVLGVSQADFDMVTMLADVEWTGERAPGAASGFKSKGEGGPGSRVCLCAAACSDALMRPPLPSTCSSPRHIHIVLTIPITRPRIPLLFANKETR